MEAVLRSQPSSHAARERQGVGVMPYGSIMTVEVAVSCFSLLLNGQPDSGRTAPKGGLLSVRSGRTTCPPLSGQVVRLTADPRSTKPPVVSASVSVPSSRERRTDAPTTGDQRLRAPKPSSLGGGAPSCRPGGRT